MEVNREKTFGDSKEISMVSVIIVVLFTLSAVFQAHESGRYHLWTYGIYTFILSTCICLTVVTKRRGVVHRDVTMFILGFLVFLALLAVPSVFFDNVSSALVDGAINKFAVLALFTVMLFFLTQVSNIGRVHYGYVLLATFACIALISAFGGLQEMVSGQVFYGTFAIENPTHPDLRVSGYYYNPNDFAFPLGIGAIVFFYKLSSCRGGTKKVIIFFALMFLLFLILHSQSRKAIFGVGLAVSVYWLMRPPITARCWTVRLVSMMVVLFVAAAVFVAFLALFASADAVELLAGALRPESIMSLTGRTHIWSAVPSILGESSLLEILFGSGNDYFVQSTGRSAHNSYIQILIDSGLLSLCVLIFILMSTAVKALLNRNQRTALEAVFIAILFYIVVSVVAQAGLLSGGLLSFYFISSLLFFHLPKSEGLHHHQTLCDEGGVSVEVVCRS